MRLSRQHAAATLALPHPSRGAPSRVQTHPGPSSLPDRVQVFPRVGLKAFTALPPDDKTAQLHELSNIVSGIRLFNRHIGKGGAGISDLPADHVR